MSREINKDLFGIRETPAFEGRRTPGGSPSPSQMSPMDVGFEVREEDWRILINQVEQLKRRNKELEAKIETNTSRMDDLLRAAKTRIDRVGAATQRLEEMSKMKFQEMTAKLSTLAGKVTERKVADTKIEQMVSRYNQSLQGFELRTQQLQKLISEQEMQIHNYKSALNEAQREIARLKHRV